MMLNWKKMDGSFENSTNKPRHITSRRVKLEEPVRCSCDGKLVYISGDLHNSAGMIPCQNMYCEGGWVTHKSKPVYRVPYNKK